MKKNNIGYLLREGIRGVFLHGFMSFAAIWVTVASLLIMGTFTLVLYNLNEMIRDLEKDNQVLVYIDESFSEAKAKSVGSQINMITNVHNAQFVSREQALADFVEEHLEQFEVPMKISTKLMVAVDEIYSNIVHYSGASQAKVQILKEADTLRLIFRDNGKPYNPLDAEEPDVTAAAEDRTIGGLGIFMVRKMMDNVEYMYKDGQNVLTLMMKVETFMKH